MSEQYLDGAQRVGQSNAGSSHTHTEIDVIKFEAFISYTLQARALLSGSHSAFISTGSKLGAK